MKRKIFGVLLWMVFVTTILTGCEKAPVTNAESIQEDDKTNEASKDSEKDEEKRESQQEKIQDNNTIYMLNANSKADEAWQSLADSYTKNTGINVKIISPDSKDYDSVLRKEMAGEDTPTIFGITNASQVMDLSESFYDLKDTSLYKHIIDKTLAIENEGKTVAIADSYNCYGIIYNNAILKDYCSLDGAVIKSAEDIRSFNTLFEVATDINNRIEEINDEFGYDLTGAFAAAALDTESSQRFTKQLASLPLYYEFKKNSCDPIVGENKIDGTYLDQYKAVWDMYISTSGAYPQNLGNGTLNPQMELGTLEAVFYQGGDWELEKIINANAESFVSKDDFGMLPIYFDVDDSKQGLCVGTESYWAINGKADKERIERSIEFLDWVITSKEGRNMLAKNLELAMPYDTFTEEYATNNKFIITAKEYIDAGKISVPWSYLATPNGEKWRSDLTKALIVYSDGSGDWAEVKAAFVDGWND